MSLVIALALSAWSTAFAQEEYGAKGIYPIYETSGQWVIFDKNSLAEKNQPAQESPLSTGSRFLVVGSQGAQIFTVSRSSAAYGGACKKNQPVKVKTALLKGPRAKVGSPIIGISVPESFTLNRSQAKYVALSNEVGETTYRLLT